MKKKEEKIGRVISVREEHIEQILILWDSSDKNKNKLCYFKLWNYIAQLYPETRENKWQLLQRSVFDLKLKEVL